MSLLTYIALKFWWVVLLIILAALGLLSKDRE